MRKDHFVSRFYLQGFTDLNATEEKPFLSVFLLKQRKWVRLAPENLGVEGDFYTVPTSKGKGRGIESALADVEDAAATVLRERITKRLDLTAEDRGRFSLFVASLLDRVPAALGGIGKTYDDIARLYRLQQLQIWRENPGAFKAAIAKYRDDHGENSLPTDPAPEDLFPEVISVSPPTGVLAITTLSVAAHTAPIIAGMGWLFIFTASTERLVTSDNPVCLIDPTIEGGSPAGLLSRTSQIWFPVTQNILFLAAHGQYPLGYLSASPTGGSVAQTANVLTISRAQRFIAGPASDFPGSDELPQEESEER